MTNRYYISNSIEYCAVGTPFLRSHLAFVKFCYTDSLRFAKENEINEAREDVMRTFSVNRFVSLMAPLAVKLLRDRQLRLLGLDPHQIAAFLAAAAAS